MFSAGREKETKQNHIHDSFKHYTTVERHQEDYVRVRANNPWVDGMLESCIIHRMSFDIEVFLFMGYTFPLRNIL